MTKTLIRIVFCFFSSWQLSAVFSHGLQPSEFPKVRYPTTTGTPPPSLVKNKRIVIVGAGPVGLYTAMLLLQPQSSEEELPRSITLLEAKSLKEDITKNAFGIGINPRMRESLDAIPGLTEFLTKYTRSVRPGIDLISRSDLTAKMREFLVQLDRCKKLKFRLCYEEACTEIDLSKKSITTSQGKKLEYDLLIACDGVHSKVRSQLHREGRIQVEHYIAKTKWKVLHLPRQQSLGKSTITFLPLRHRDILAGRILPRYPDGYIVPLFWQSQYNNPGNVTNIDELKRLLNEAVVPPKDWFDRESTRSTWQRFFRPNIFKGGNSLRLEFDDDCLQAFLDTPQPGTVHSITLNQYYDEESCTALVGDAAHGMPSLVGQGCAMGLKGARFLVEALKNPGGSSSVRTLSDALVKYNDHIRPEAIAAHDLNFIGNARSSPVGLFLLSVGGGLKLFPKLSDTSLSYQDLLKMFRRVIGEGRRQWNKHRIPYEEK